MDFFLLHLIYIYEWEGTKKNDISIIFNINKQREKTASHMA